MDKTEYEQHIKTKTNSFKQTYLKSPQYTHLEEKLVNFYNQPAAYLNYLLEYVFKNHKDYYLNICNYYLQKFSCQLILLMSIQLCCLQINLFLCLFSN